MTLVTDEMTEVKSLCIKLVLLMLCKTYYSSYDENNVIMVTCYTKAVFTILCTRNYSVT